MGDITIMLSATWTASPTTLLLLPSRTSRICEVIALLLAHSWTDTADRLDHRAEDLFQDPDTHELHLSGYIPSNAGLALVIPVDTYTGNDTDAPDAPPSPI